MLNYAATRPLTAKKCPSPMCAALLLQYSTAMSGCGFAEALANDIALEYTAAAE